MMEPVTTLRGQLTARDYTLPAWAQGTLHLMLWDRAEGPETPLATAPLGGPHGTFDLSLAQDAALRLAMVGHGQGPHHLLSVGWGAGLEPLLATLPWPDAGANDAAPLGWRGDVAILGYVEQMHVLEEGGLPLAVLEVTGQAVPHTYRRLPPLPLSVLDDRHGLHTDRRLEDCPEHVYYLLADLDSPLAAVAQDALVSNLRVACFASLGEDDGGWDALVNLPLILDSLTLLAP